MKIIATMGIILNKNYIKICDILRTNPAGIFKLRQTIWLSKLTFYLAVLITK